MARGRLPLPDTSGGPWAPPTQMSAAPDPFRIRRRPATVAGRRRRGSPRPGAGRRRL